MRYAWKCKICDTDHKMETWSPWNNNVCPYGHRYTNEPREGVPRGWLYPNDSDIDISPINTESIPMIYAWRCKKCYKVKEESIWSSWDNNTCPYGHKWTNEPREKIQRSLVFSD